MKSCIISLAVPVDNMNRILSSNWLPKRTNKVSNFWTMPVVESQKSTEERQNKENMKDCRRLIVLQTQLAFFLGSGSKKVILDSFKIKRNLLLNDVKVLNRAKESEANIQSSWSKTFLTLSVIHLHFQPTTAFFSERKEKIIAVKHLLSG